MKAAVNGHFQKIEISIKGMDCTDCARHIKEAVESVPGVAEAEVLFSAQKAVVSLDPVKADLADICKAVESAGYAVATAENEDVEQSSLAAFSRQVLTLFGAVFGIVLFVAVVGEWFGLPGGAAGKYRCARRCLYYYTAPRWASSL